MSFDTILLLILSIFNLFSSLISSEIFIFISLLLILLLSFEKKLNKFFLEFFLCALLVSIFSKTSLGNLFSFFAFVILFMLCITSSFFKAFKEFILFNISFDNVLKLEEIPDKCLQNFFKDSFTVKLKLAKIAFISLYILLYFKLFSSIDSFILSS